MSAETATKKPNGKNRTQGRSLARLAAVQALFQIEFSKADSNDILEEFLEHRFRRPHENTDVDFADADKSYFKKIVTGVMLEMTDLNDMVRATLPREWPLDRLDPEIRAMLRAAAFELSQTTTPSPAIVSEYIGIAEAFYEGENKSFMGGALNGLIARIRPGDVDK